MLGSDGLAGLQMGFGINVRWALEGKHTKRSADGAPLVSLPFMLIFFQCFVLTDQSLSACFGVYIYIFFFLDQILRLIGFMVLGC